MTNKHFNWHRAWVRDAQGHLVHATGLRFTVSKGDGYVDLETDDASLAIFQARETSRGVPTHQLLDRLQRLTKEARMFYERTQHD